MTIPAALQSAPFRDVKWGPDDKPVLILDGKAIPIRDVVSPIHGDAAYIVGVDQRAFDQVCSRLRVPTIQFYEMRVSNLSALRQLGNVTHLAIRWNTKVADLSLLPSFASLETLVLEDTPKAQDLAPLRLCPELRQLEFSGGLMGKNTAEDLSPLALLNELQSLTLLNLKIVSGGLRPLAGCRKLQSLTLSNQFPTEDYAYLSVHLPHTKCDMFAPYVAMADPIGDNDVMVVGQRKPFLNSNSDKK